MIGIFCAMAALRMVTSSSRGIFPLGRVDDKIDVAVFDPVEHMGTAFANLEHPGHGTGRFECSRRSARGNNPETELNKFSRDRNDGRFIDPSR